MAIRRLFLDLETSPNVGVFWQAGSEIDVGHECILEERQMICACYKWEGERDVHVITWNAAQQDGRVAEKVSALFEEADEIVAHNGNRFDIPWVRARCIKHGFPVSPRLVTHDTCALARNLFKFNSNRLDYLGRYLGVGRKIETGGLSLWLQVMDGDQKALDKMVKYCKQDVNLLERVWKKMLPYIPAKSHTTGNIHECPECGSKSMRVSKRRTLASGAKQVQLKCNDCGKYTSMSAGKYDRAQ